MFIGFVSLPTMAQEFNGGLFAGFNASQVAGDVASGYNKAGLLFGGFVSRPLSVNSEIRMELMYSQKGSRMNPDESNDFRSYLLRLNYVDLPFLYRHRINENFWVEIGLSYGYLIHHFELANFSSAVSSTEFIRHAFNALVGLEYRLNNSMALNLRSGNSILPLRDHSSGVKRFFNRGQYNDVLSFSFSYVIGINKD